MSLDLNSLINFLGLWIILVMEPKQTFLFLFLFLPEKCKYNSTVFGVSSLRMVKKQRRLNIFILKGSVGPWGTEQIYECWSARRWDMSTNTILVSVTPPHACYVKTGEKDDCHITGEWLRVVRILIKTANL